uniref:hypothetical protein n=1 Tax=Brochothrix campestris TaxID=2757 RepID=UPI003D465FD3
MSSKLNRLERLAGNIEPKQKYTASKTPKANLEEIEKNLKIKEEAEKGKEKINNQKNTLKYGDDVRIKLEAQKQIEGVKFDYKFLELLLDRNAGNFSPRDRAKYNILIEED